MKRWSLSLIAILSMTGVLGTTALAQIPLIPEDHYVVYENNFPNTFAGPVRLTDQFAIPVDASAMVLEFVGRLTRKNNEPIFFGAEDHNWWSLGNQPPQDEKLVGIDNQFGRQDLIVRNPRYLLNPAVCTTPPVVDKNHYLCYDAEGPSVNAGVLLEEMVCSVGQNQSVALEPVYFCNPVIKEVAGQTTPIFQPDAHITVYRLSDPTNNAQVNVDSIDQFGVWDVQDGRGLYLEVPTFKLTVVSTEETSWGMIKSRFEN